MITTLLKFPGNPTETELRSLIVNECISKLIPQFIFGYHDYMDMYQQCWIWSLELLSSDKYDDKRPLEKLLYIHLRNQLLNFRRKFYFRKEAPCNKCPFSCALSKKESGCELFDTKSNCEKFLAWQKNNSAKQSLMHNAESVDIAGECPVLDSVIYNDILVNIDKKLPIELLSDYRKILAGDRISEIRKEAVRVAILLIMEENNGA